MAETTENSLHIRVSCADNMAEERFVSLL